MLLLSPASAFVCAGWKKMDGAREKVSDEWFMRGRGVGAFWVV